MSHTDVAKRSFSASVILVAGNVLSNILLVIAALILARLLGPSAYGAYAIALLPYSIFLLFTGLGVNTAITRYSAFHISRGEIEDAKRMTASAIKFVILVGILLTIACYLTAPFVASAILRRPELTSTIQLSSLTILGQAIYQSGIQSFVGWGSMKAAGATAVIQGALKLAFSPALVVLGFGVFGAVAGHTVAFLVTGAVCGSAIYFTKLKGGARSSIRATIADIGEEIRYGLPTHIGTYLSNFASGTYVLIILAIISENTIVGYFQAAVNITIVISLISTAVSLSLFQAFATLDGRKADTKIAFVYAVKYVSYVSTPVILFIAAAAPALLFIIYGQSYLSAANLLSLIALSYEPMAIGLAVFPSFFNGVGRTRLTMLALLTETGATAGLAPLLGFFMSAEGIAYALLVSNWVSSIVALYFAKRYYETEIDYVSSLLALVSSVIAFAFARSLAILNVSVLVTFGLQAAVFFSVYFVVAPLLRVINQEDVSNLRLATGGLGPVSQLLAAVLNLESKILEWSSGRHPKRETILDSARS